MSEKNQTKSNGRGGKRANAGRKAGSATKKTREIADKAMEEGISPLEVMLFAMRALMTEAEQVVEAQRKAGEPIVWPHGLLQDAADVAKDAAPYIHPRLAAIEHTGAEGGPVQFTKVERVIVDPKD
jgi:hypothetical protein